MDATIVDLRYRMKDVLRAIERRETESASITAARQKRQMIFDTDVLIWASRGNLRAARTIDAAEHPIGASAAQIVERHALAHGIQLADALIAATAIEADQAICTGNIKHFRPIRNLL